MQYTALAALSLAAVASAQTGAANPSGGIAGAGNGAGTDYQATAFDTVVVSAYVTTCPGNVGSTTFAYNGQTYSGTANQVITVTNCPCTVTAPAGSIPSGATIATAPYVAGPTTTPATNNHAAGSGSGSGSGAGSGTGAGSGATNGTTSPNTPEQYTGAASKATGAGLAGLFALFAWVL